MLHLGIAAAIIVWVFYLAMIYGSTALALVGFAGSFFLIFSYIGLFWMKKKCSARMEIPLILVQQGEKIMIRLQTEIGGRLQPGKVRCQVEVRHVFSGKKKKKWFFGNSEYQYRIKQAGSYEVCLKKIRIYDLSGFFYVTGKTDQNIIVDAMPEIYDIPVQLTETVRNFFGDADCYDEFRPGYDPAELFDVREFCRGDRVQNIHWKLSAKADMWMVKEYSRPKACAITVLVDFNDNGKKQRGEADACLKLVTGLSFSLMDQKCAHYVAWYSTREQALVRTRVDDEESFYLFLYQFLKAEKKQKPDVVSMYREKYRHEHLAYLLVVTMNLEIKCGDGIIGKANKERLGQSMGEMGLVL